VAFMPGAENAVCKGIVKSSLFALETSYEHVDVDGGSRGTSSLSADASHLSNQTVLERI
jgi:hypothetical protein